VLQHLRQRCAECVINQKRDVREEQHPYTCGVNNGLLLDKGVLFHITQPTSRSATRSHCTRQTNH